MPAADDTHADASLPILHAAQGSENIVLPTSLSAVANTDITRPSDPVAADHGAQALDSVESLRVELREQSEQVEELENDLQAAEEQIHRLEAQLRRSSARVALLLQQSRQPEAAENDSMLGTTPDVARLLAAADASDDMPTSINAATHVAATAPSVAPSHEGRAVPINGAARFLVQIDGDGDVLHLLGRRTTVGRGTGNDIQIDQRFVSRHHAILIAGPNQTVIEDLRSTNGVLVNGQRVRRCVLNDGDLVLIGKTQMRFALRRNQAE